jgi:cobalamin biosynthesis protein CobW
MHKKIPILALTGFLGSGKTSLLNHILKENQGLKIGVIVNDFGSINIDSLLVARQTDSKLELSNGCICCAVEDSGLDDAISQLAHTGSTLDYIVIEASGLAEPKELVNILAQSKNKFARLDSVVAVIDTENVMEMNEKHPDFFKQLEIADIIILNKVDLVSKSKLEEIEGYLDFLGVEARKIKAEFGAINTHLLLDADALKRREVSKGSQIPLTDNHSDHLHETYQKVTFSSTKPLDPKSFEEYMRLRVPKSIYRAKGFVYFGIKGLEQKFIFQLVGKRFTLRLDDWRGQVPKTDIVLIGEKLDESKLQKELEELVDKNPDDISGNLLDLNLYR